MKPFFIILLSSTISFSQSLNICYENQDYYPYVVSNFQKYNGQKGVLVDLISKAAQKLNIKLTLEMHPWKRCIERIKTSKANAIFAAIHSKDREEWATFPMKNGEPNSELRLWRVKYLIFASRKSTISWDGVKFSGIKTGIAAPPGYIALKKLKELGVIYEKFLLPANGLELVAKNRIDGYVVESQIGKSVLLDSKNSTMVKTLPNSFMESDWYVPFSKSFYETSKKVVDQFWSEVANARVELSDKILDSYQLSKDI